MTDIWASGFFSSGQASAPQSNQESSLPLRPPEAMRAESIFSFANDHFSRINIHIRLALQTRFSLTRGSSDQLLSSFNLCRPSPYPPRDLTQSCLCPCCSRKASSLQVAPGEALGRGWGGWGQELRSEPSRLPLQPLPFLPLPPTPSPGL